MAELERLRDAYLEIAPADAEHLGDEQWERLACDDLESAERETLLDHILSCSQCSRTYRALLAVRREGHTFDPGAPRPTVEREMARSWRWRGMLLGLAAAAAVIMGVLVVEPRLGTGPAPPASQPPVTLRSVGSVAGPALVAPLGTLAGTPGELSWRPVEGARGYVVELLDGDGELVWKSEELKVTSTPWPRKIAAAPGRYYWRVLAIPEGGGEPAASDLESFDVEVSASPR